MKDISQQSINRIIDKLDLDADTSGSEIIQQVLSMGWDFSTAQRVMATLGRGVEDENGNEIQL